MAVIAVVLAVADTPAVVGHQDAGVCDVAHQVIQVTAAAEALVATAREKPTHVSQLHASMHGGLSCLQ